MHGIGYPDDNGREDPDTHDNPFGDPLGCLHPPPHQRVEGMYGNRLEHRDMSVCYAATSIK